MNVTGGKLDRVEIREIAGVFTTRENLRAAIDGLLLSGFDRADLDLMGSVDALREKNDDDLHINHNQLSENAPRQPVITQDDIYLATTVIISLLAAVGTLGAALLAFVLTRSTAASLLAAAAGGCIGGAIGFWGIRHFLPMQRSADLDSKLKSGGVILWVRAWSPEKAAKARDLLVANGARAIRSHEIEITGERERPSTSLGTISACARQS
jgi:hypothetical protein